MAAAVRMVRRGGTLGKADEEPRFPTLGHRGSHFLQHRRRPTSKDSIPQNAASGRIWATDLLDSASGRRGGGLGIFI
jgi:hypothetical protein